MSPPNAESSPGSRGLARLAPLLLAVAVAAPYLAGLDNGFVWIDGREIVEGGVTVESATELGELFTPRGIYAGYARPLYKLMHSLDLALWGREPFGFYLSSLLLHVGNALLLWLLLGRLGWSALARFGVALVFGLHPVNTAAAGLIHSKADLLVTAFLLGAALFAERHVRRDRASPLAPAGALVCFTGALLTKELAFVAPLGATLVLLGPARGLEAQARQRLRRLVAGTWVLALGLGALRVSAAGEGLSTWSSPLSLGERIATFGPVYVEYLGKLLVPLDLTICDTVSAWSALPSSSRTWTGAALAVLVGVQVHAFRTRPRLRPWILLFHLALLPVAQLVPILHFRADRYLYLPSLAFAGALVEVARLAAPARHARVLAALGLVALGGAYAARILPRLELFANDETLFLAEIQRTPDYREGLSVLARHYDVAGRHDRAAVLWAGCVEPVPGRISFVEEAAVVVNFSYHLLQTGRPNDAYEFLAARGPGVRSAVHSSEIVYNRGVAAFALERWEEAADLLEEYALGHPEDAGCRYLLGVSALRAGRGEAGREALRAYLELRPDSPRRAEVEALLSSDP